MPFTMAPRSRVIATGLACRVVVAARMESPTLAWRILRALRFAWFTSGLLLDEEDALRSVLQTIPGADAPHLVDRTGDPDVEDAYQQDRAEARSAAGSPSHAQGKTASSAQGERYTAPSLILETADGRRVEAGGSQPLAVYDALIANLEPELERRPPAATALEAIEAFDHGLTTREVALIMAAPGREPNDTAAAEELIHYAAARKIACVPIGSDALWVPPASGPFERLRAVRDLIAASG